MNSRFAPVSFAEPATCLPLRPLNSPIRVMALGLMAADVMAEDIADVEPVDDFDISFAPHAVSVRANAAAAAAAIGLMTMWISFDCGGVPVTPSQMKLGGGPARFDKHFRTVRTELAPRRLSRLSSMRGAMWMRP